MGRLPVVIVRVAVNVALAASVFAACSTAQKPVDPGAFDQRCTKDEDCEMVAAGDPCAHCVCYGAAVASADAKRARTLFEERRARCHVDPGWKCEPCLAQKAICRAARCAIIPLPLVDAGP